MSSIILIAISLLAGIVLGKIKSIPKDSYKVLNAIIINISLPALAILYIPDIKISSELFYPLSVMWIVFFAGAIIFLAAAKIYKLNKPTTGALILTGALCNSSFIGFPVLRALFGEEGLKIGVVIDQTGSFVILATFGVIIASVFSKGDYSLKKIFKNIILYPPFIAFLIGVMLNVFHISLGILLRDILGSLGGLVSMLALISVGMQLKFTFSGISIKQLILGLSYKLILAPLLVYILFYLILNNRTLNSQVSIIEASMPTMILGAILADEYKLNPQLSNMMVALGIPLSIITITLWYYILKI